MRFDQTAAPEATAEEDRYSVDFIEEVRARLNALIAASSNETRSAIDNAVLYNN